MNKAVDLVRRVSPITHGLSHLTLTTSHLEVGRWSNLPKLSYPVSSTVRVWTLICLQTPHSVHYPTTPIFIEIHTTKIGRSLANTCLLLMSSRAWLVLSQGWGVPKVAPSIAGQSYYSPIPFYIECPIDLACWPRVLFPFRSPKHRTVEGAECPSLD